MATATNDKPLRLGDLPVVKTNILENARQFDKVVVGGYSGTFPLTAASQGGIYLLPSTGKFYVCETAYNGAQISAPNSNFVELSVWKNHDRLSNLNIILYDSNTGIDHFTIPEKYRHFKFFLVNIYTSKNSHFDGVSTYLMSVDSESNITSKLGFFYSDSYNYWFLDKDYTIKKHHQAISSGTDGFVTKVIALV